MIKVKIKTSAGVSKTGKTGYFDDLIAELKAQISYEQMNDIAQGAVDAMAKKLDNSIKRDGSTSTLRDSLSVELIPHKDGSFTLGIGDVRQLPDYWYVLNYGYMYNSKAPFIPYRGKGRLGFFIGEPNKPSKQFTTGNKCTGTQEWYNFEDYGSFMLKAKTAITPVNYIEAGEKYITKRLNRFKGTSLGKKTTHK